MTCLCRRTALLSFVLAVVLGGCNSKGSDTTTTGFDEAVFSFSTDDGHRAFNRELAGLFAKYGFHYTLGIVSEWALDPRAAPVGYNDIMSMNELPAYAAAGHEIASHSATHPPLTPREALVLTLGAGGPWPTVALAVSERGVSLAVGRAVRSMPHGTIAELARLLHAASLDGFPCDARLYDPDLGPLSTSRLVARSGPGPEAGEELVLELLLGSTAKDLVRELAGSKRTLEEQLGVSVTTLIYPYTANTSATRLAAREAGYLVARAGRTMRGSNVWDCKYEEIDYPSSIVVMGGNDTIHQLTREDLLYTPSSLELEGRITDIQEQYEAGSISLKDVRNALRRFVDGAVGDNRWVQYYDHGGLCHLWLWDEILSVLAADPRVKVLPIGEAYQYLSQQNPELRWP